MEPNQKNTSIEVEIQKQLDKLDKRFDRNGWFFLVVLMLILFLLIYLFMNVFRVPETDVYQSNTDIRNEIQLLQERVESLELEIENLRTEEE